MASQTLYLGQLGSVSPSLCLFTLLTGSLWIAYRLRPRNHIAETDYAGRAARVLKSTPLIDGHNDLPYLLRIELQNQVNGGKFNFHEGKNSHLPLF
jgi:membrane dipeptidase